MGLIPLSRELTVKSKITTHHHLASDCLPAYLMPPQRGLHLDSDFWRRRRRSLSSAVSALVKHRSTPSTDIETAATTTAAVPGPTSAPAPASASASTSASDSSDTTTSTTTIAGDPDTSNTSETPETHPETHTHIHPPDPDTHKMFESKLPLPPLPTSDVFNYIFHYGRRAYPWSRVVYRVDSTDETLTLAQLEDQSLRLARAIKKKYGIKPNDVISIAAQDGVRPLVPFHISDVCVC